MDREAIWVLQNSYLRFPTWLARAWLSVPAKQGGFWHISTLSFPSLMIYRLEGIRFPPVKSVSQHAKVCYLR